MIAEYLVCAGETTIKLQEAVNDAIRRGWQPFGGISGSAYLGWYNEWSLEPVGSFVDKEVQLFCQAMVKETAGMTPTTPESAIRISDPSEQVVHGSETSGPTVTTLGDLINRKRNGGR